MNEISFATAENVRQPKGGLVLTPEDPRIFVLGSNDPRKLGQIINESRDWTRFLPPIVEIQRLLSPDPVTGELDTYWCTIFSDNEIDETINNKKYPGSQIDISEKFVAIGTNTQRGVGNSMSAAPEFKRKKGILFENEKPFNRSVTMDEAYSENTAEDYDLAKTRLDLYNFGYLGTGGSGQRAILDALKVSPVKVAVQGNYSFDSNNRMINNGTDYTHAVFIFNAILDANGYVSEYHIRDSEGAQYLRF